MFTKEQIKSVVEDKLCLYCSNKFLRSDDNIFKIGEKFYSCDSCNISVYIENNVLKRVNINSKILRTIYESLQYWFRIDLIRGETILYLASDYICSVKIIDDITPLNIENKINLYLTYNEN